MLRLQVTLHSTFIPQSVILSFFSSWTSYLLLSDCNSVVCVVDQTGDDHALEDSRPQEEGRTGQLLLVQVDVLVLI